MFLLLCGMQTVLENVHKPLCMGCSGSQKWQHALNKRISRFSASNIFYMWRSAFSDGTLIPFHAFHRRFCPYSSRFVTPKQLWIFVQSLYNGTCGNSPAFFEITSKRTTFRLRNRPLSLNLATLLHSNLML